MRALAVIALVLALPAAALAATPKTTLPDVEDEVMCITCGTALNVSQAPSADRERAFIRRRIAEGLTKDQIKQRLVAEYGPKVLAEPHQETSWLVPAVLALLAVLTVALTVRRWRRTAELKPAADLDAEDNRRLDRDMAGYDL
jgi:cytochrome c-type biogenesis protein CcmH/NrfF